jgi:SAM-dependent methyltransferase
MKKVNLGERYFEKEEVRENPNPYYDFFWVLSKTFRLKSLSSFLDLGCATGWLLYYLKKEYPEIFVKGVEYFEFHKNAAHDLIKESIDILDLRDEINLGRKFDIINSTEVGEHIDPAFTSVYMQNLKNHCGKYLILSWGNTGGEHDRKRDPNLQHLNPLSFEKVSKLCSENGFKLDEEKTKELVYYSKRAPKIELAKGIIPILRKKLGLNFDQVDGFYPWWRSSLSVWSTQVR